MPRWPIELYLDTPDGREWIDPSAASALTRPDGGGATIESVADLLDGSHKKATGVYFVDAEEGGGSYAEDTWYELEVTWTYAGEARTAYRRVYYRGEGTAVDAATALTVASDGDGDAVTATVTGTAGVTYRLLYQTLAASLWTEGESRVGSGDIAQAGLDNDTWYRFCVVGVSGTTYSLPTSAPAPVYVTDGASAVTPSGIYSLLLVDLQALVAACPTFQTWVGAGDATEALASIHRVAVDRDTATLPFAVVAHFDDAEFESTLEGRGSLALRFVAEVGEDDVVDAETEFTNQVGAVLGELLALEGLDGRMFVRYVRSLGQPVAPSDDETRTKRYRQDWAVHWGLETGR